MSVKFLTDQGIEVPSVNTEQMIEVDRVAMEETGPNLFQMLNSVPIKNNLVLLLNVVATASAWLVNRKTRPKS